MHEDLPKSRAAARMAGSKLYFTGKPCKHGHVAERSTKDAICQECNRVKARNWKNANPELKRQQDKNYRLANLERMRESGRRRAAKDPIPARKRARKWRLDNPERASANERVKRARKRGATGKHTADDVASLLVMQKYKCVYCGVSIRKKENRHVDHIMPLKLGGTNDKTNLQVLCATCNMSKKATHPIDYARRIGLLL